MLVVSEVCVRGYGPCSVREGSARSEKMFVGRSAAGAAVGVAEGQITTDAGTPRTHIKSHFAGLPRWNFPARPWYRHAMPKKTAPVKHKKIPPQETAPRRCPLASSGMDIEEFCAIGECQDGDPQRLVSNLKGMIGGHLSPMLVKFLCEYLMKHKARRTVGRPKKRKNPLSSPLVESFAEYRQRGMSYQVALPQVAEDHSCSESTVARALKKYIFLRPLWRTRSRRNG